jgi:hypothetical protein
MLGGFGLGGVGRKGLRGSRVNPVGDAVWLSLCRLCHAEDENRSKSA